MKRLALVPSLVLFACGGQVPPCPAGPMPTLAASSSAHADANAVRTAPSASSTYSGHGASSLPPAILEKYRPKPLASEISRRIQALMDLGAPGSGLLAPDGRSLYFGWAVTGNTQLWKLDGPRRFPTQLTGGEDATSIAGMAPSGAYLVVTRDRKGEENPGIYLQSPGGGPLTEIQHKEHVQTSLDAISNDSRFVYFRANDRKNDSYALYRYDVEKKLKELVFDQDGIWQIADLKDDGRLLLEKHVGSNMSEVFEYDPAKKALTPLFGQGEREEYDAQYGAKDGEVIVRTNKPGEFRRLYSWEAAKLTPISDDVKADVDSFTIDRKKTRILFEVNDNGFLRLRALDAKTKRPIGVPTLPEADNVYIGATTPDARFTTLAIDDGRHPSQAYVLDWRTGTLEKWHSPSTPELDTTTFARAKAESYPAKDGTKIPVLVRRPLVCASDPCPVIVHFHGGPESQTRPGFDVRGQMFVDAGFVFVEPNVRGSDGYGKAWVHADDGPKRLDVIGDIEDAAKWARTEFASNGRAPKVGIYGGSYGGYAVLMGMTMFAGAYDAGVDIVGISNLSTFLMNTAPYRRILRISEYGDPEKDRDALTKLSPMTYVDRVKAPLLIFQGATDPRVPAGEAVQIHEAFQQRGIASELMIFPDEGHGARKRENRVLMYGHAIAFFKKHLLGR